MIADGEHLISNTKIFGENVGVGGIALNANIVARLDHVKIVDAKIPVQGLPSGGFTTAVNVLSPLFLCTLIDNPLHSLDVMTCFYK